MTKHQLSLADSLIDDVEALLSGQKPLLSSSAVVPMKTEAPRFQEEKVIVSAPPSPPPVQQKQQQQPQFDFTAISNPPYVSAMAQQQQFQQQPRFQQVANFHLPGGNAPYPSSQPVFTFTNAQSQQMNNMANAAISMPQHPNPNAVHSQQQQHHQLSRFITAPGDENGVPPPLMLLEEDSSSYQPQEAVLALESLYRDASGVNTQEGNAGQGRATSPSIDDTTNRRFKEDFEDGAMPHGENDEGAAEFETRFRSVRSRIVPNQQVSNLANMYQNARMYMPGKQQQGLLHPFSSPMGQDVQRFKSVGKRRVDPKTNAVALSPEQYQKQLEIEKMEAWMKDHGNDDHQSNLRGIASSSNDGDDNDNDAGSSTQDEKKEGEPIYDNTVPSEPEAGKKRKYE